MAKLARLITTLFPRIPSQDAKEHAYLADAVSLYDLECRERDIERGLFAPATYRQF